MYKKLSGMTGTAKTEATEFTEIYGLNIVSVTTTRPVLCLVFLVVFFLFLFLFLV